ncbi:MAG: hypothetical protein K8R56_05435 [Candidatus Eisenbacteria bacterium]|nr:hypothetical protein [Candidatus Eisenbacteria bacterium]
MKPLRFVSVLVLMLCAAGVAQAQSPRLVGAAQFLVSSEAATAPSPCDDSIFVSLQGRALDSLSTREYEYFMLKTKECGEYRKAALAGGGKSAPAGTTEQVGISSFSAPAEKHDGSALAAVAIVVGVAALILTISLASGLHDMFNIFGN